MGIDETEFVIFDTETTGLSPAAGDMVVEVAALRSLGGRVSASFESLIQTGVPVSEGAFRVNQISPQMLEDAPVAHEVWPRFLEFSRCAVWCTYNAPFDMGFLCHELSLLGRTLPEGVAVIDVLRMARALMPGLSRYALWCVAEANGMQLAQRHRAMADVEMTHEVFRSLLEIARAKGVTDLEGLVKCFGYIA
jgi:DNA polymerase III subunit epsilon